MKKLTKLRMHTFSRSARKSGQEEQDSYLDGFDPVKIPPRGRALANPSSVTTAFRELQERAQCLEEEIVSLTKEGEIITNKIATMDNTREQMMVDVSAKRLQHSEQLYHIREQGNKTRVDIAEMDTNIIRVDNDTRAMQMSITSNRGVKANLDDDLIELRKQLDDVTSLRDSLEADCERRKAACSKLDGKLTRLPKRYHAAQLKVRDSMIETEDKINLMHYQLEQQKVQFGTVTRYMEMLLSVNDEICNTVLAREEAKNKVLRLSGRINLPVSAAAREGHLMPSLRGSPSGGSSSVDAGLEAIATLAQRARALAAQDTRHNRSDGPSSLQRPAGMRQSQDPSRPTSPLSVSTAATPQPGRNVYYGTPFPETPIAQDVDELAREIKQGLQSSSPQAVAPSVAADKAAAAAAAANAQGTHHSQVSAQAKTAKRAKKTKTTTRTTTSRVEGRVGRRRPQRNQGDALGEGDRLNLKHVNTATGSVPFSEVMKILASHTQQHLYSSSVRDKAKKAATGLLQAGVGAAAPNFKGKKKKPQTQKMTMADLATTPSTSTSIADPAHENASQTARFFAGYGLSSAQQRPLTAPLVCFDFDGQQSRAGHGARARETYMRARKAGVHDGAHENDLGAAGGQGQSQVSVGMRALEKMIKQHQSSARLSAHTHSTDRKKTSKVAQKHTHIPTCVTSAQAKKLRRKIRKGERRERDGSAGSADTAGTWLPVGHDWNAPSTNIKINKNKVLRAKKIYGTDLKWNHYLSLHPPNR